jgi:hypothetical protein
MSGLDSPYITSPIEETDTKSGFSCGKRPLDDYFARHAFPNHIGDIGRAYVLRRADDADANLPPVLGFYTLNMASAESAPVASVLEKKLPKYAMPVALIGRLAVDRRAQGKEGKVLDHMGPCRIPPHGPPMAMRGIQVVIAGK